MIDEDALKQVLAESVEGQHLRGHLQRYLELTTDSGPVDPPPPPPPPGDSDAWRVLADVAKFRNPDTGNTFVAFHEVGAPSDPEALGLIHLDLIYQSAFLPGSSGSQGQDDRTRPTTSRIRNAVSNAARIFVPDIELWWPKPGNGTDPTDDAAIANFEFVSNEINLVKGNKIWGWYSTLPQRSYFAPVRGGSLFDRWQNSNNRLRGIANLVDVMFPSIYMFDSLRDPNDWVRYAIGNIEEARRLAPNKPIVPFLWPWYHSAGTDPIEAEIIELQLKTCLDAGCAGACIWATNQQRKASASIHKDWIAGFKSFRDKFLMPI